MVSTRNDEHDLLAADFAESTSTWEQQNAVVDQIFRDKERLDHSRAADLSFEQTKVDFVLVAQPSKVNKDDKQISTEKAFFPVFSEDFASLYCFASVAPLVLWTHLKQFFEDTPHVDPEVNEEARVVFGNFYQTPQKCSFLASVAQTKDSNESVLDVRRLEGDAFLLNDFFKILQKHLVDLDLVTAKDEDDDDIFGDEDDDDDYEDLFMSDGEEDGFGLELPDLDPHQTMMEFEYDPDMLYSMITDFKDTHMEEKNYFMSMLSHNAMRPENRNLMLDEKMHGQIKELIETQLKEKKDYSNASLTRNTCLLLKNLACEMEVDNETVKAATEAMGEWCPGKNAGRVRDKLPFIKNDERFFNIGELQGSRQSMIEISEFFSHLIEHKQFSELDLLTIMRDTLNSEQIKRIGGFISSRCEDSLQIFGDLAENVCN